MDRDSRDPFSVVSPRWRPPIVAMGTHCRRYHFTHEAVYGGGGWGSAAICMTDRQISSPPLVVTECVCGAAVSSVPVWSSSVKPPKQEAYVLAYRRGNRKPQRRIAAPIFALLGAD